MPGHRCWHRLHPSIAECDIAGTNACDMSSNSLHQCVVLLLYISRRARRYSTCAVPPKVTALTTWVSQRLPLPSLEGLDADALPQAAGRDQGSGSRAPLPQTRQLPQGGTPSHRQVPRHKTEKSAGQQGCSSCRACACCPQFKSGMHMLLNSDVGNS